jgi:uncharacterized protein YerC
LIYLNTGELTKFIKTHYDESYFNEKNLPLDNNVSLSSDDKELIVKAEFVIDNLTKTSLAQGPLKNVLTIRQMNEGLVRGLATGWKFMRMLKQGKSVLEIEKETGQNHRTTQRYINLSYLSTSIVQDIFENKNPRNMRLKELLTLASYENFKEQEKEWNLI